MKTRKNHPFDTFHDEMDCATISIRVRLMRVIYFSICLFPVAMGLFMFGGIFEGIWVTWVFITTGFALIIVILISCLASPLLRIEMLIKKGRLEKKVRMAGFVIYHKCFYGHHVQWETRKEAVATSMWFGVQEVPFLYLYGAGSRTKVAGDIETHLFHWTSDIAESANAVLNGLASGRSQ